jgi:hypothetical protein
VPAALNIGLAVLSFTVTDGKVQDLEVISGDTKKKIKRQAKQLHVCSSHVRSITHYPMHAWALTVISHTHIRCR